MIWVIGRLNCPVPKEKMQFLFSLIEKVSMAVGSMFLLCLANMTSKYFEALCHAFPDQETVVTSSARYFSRSGTSVVVPHPRVPWPVVAFLSCFRKINSQFLDDLKASLSALVNDGDKQVRWARMID